MAAASFPCSVIFYLVEVLFSVVQSGRLTGRRRKKARCRWWAALCGWFLLCGRGCDGVADESFEADGFPFVVRQFSLELAKWILGTLMRVWRTDHEPPTPRSDRKTNVYFEHHLSNQIPTTGHLSIFCLERPVIQAKFFPFSLSS